MKQEFLFSAPGQDLPLDETARARPFLIAPDTPHPNLTLGDYLTTLSAFLLDQGGRALLLALAQEDIVCDLDEIQELRIRTEKHGALYHIASVECRLSDATRKMALTTAVSEANRDRLKGEFSLLKQLHAATPEALPAAYSLADVPVSLPGKEPTMFTVMLGQWLDDFHEWHLSTCQEGPPRIQLWDYTRGYRFLDPGLESSLVRQAAAILTRHYQPATGNQIYPWHHAAGDFIVCHRPGESEMEVRLITVRDYAPILTFPAEAGILPGLLTFFLHLSLRLRLDRIDGVGAPAWLGDFAVPAFINGFFTALAEKGLEPPPVEVLEILQLFSIEDLERGCEALLALYEEEDAEDSGLVRAHLTDHCHQLRDQLQRFSLPG